MPKWPRSWVIAGATFLLFEFTMKVLAEVYSPQFLLAEVQPYFAIGVTHYRNPHSCLGVLRSFSQPWKFLVTLSASLILLVAALYAHFVKCGPHYQKAIAFLVVGAVGNLADRLTIGAVVDYVDISLGPYGSWLYLAWNFSDLAINFGASYLVVSVLKKEHPFDEDKPKNS